MVNATESFRFCLLKLLVTPLGEVTGFQPHTHVRIVCSARDIKTARSARRMSKTLLLETRAESQVIVAVLLPKTGRMTFKPRAKTPMFSHLLSRRTNWCKHLCMAWLLKRPKQTMKCALLAFGNLHKTLARWIEKARQLPAKYMAVAVLTASSKASTTSTADLDVSPTSEDFRLAPICSVAVLRRCHAWSLPGSSRLIPESNGI